MMRVGRWSLQLLLTRLETTVSTNSLSGTTCMSSSRRTILQMISLSLAQTKTKPKLSKRTKVSYSFGNLSHMWGSSIFLLRNWQPLFRRKLIVPSTLSWRYRQTRWIDWKQRFPLRAGIWSRCFRHSCHHWTLRFLGPRQDFCNWSLSRL